MRTGEEGGLARIGDRARADEAGVGDRSGFIELRRFSVETREKERLPDFADWIDIAALPGDLAGGAGVVARNAAQQALARDIGRHEGVCDLRLADVVKVVGVVEGLQAGRLKRCIGAIDVGDVEIDRELSPPAHRCGRREG